MSNDKILPYLKFYFSVLNPTLEDCWAYGYSEAKKGIDKQNPYKHHSPNYHHWEDGWWSGFYENAAHNDQIYEPDQLSETPEKLKENIVVFKKQAPNCSNFSHKKTLKVNL